MMPQQGQLLDEVVLEEELIAREREEDAARMGAAILHQPIRDLPTLRDPVCLAPESSLRAAIAGMTESRVGCVLVVAEDKLVGIFTERDVLTKIVGASIDLDGELVGSYMTVDPEALRLDDRVSYALNKMVVGGFRHIPLVDEDDQPVGVVSMRNVVEYMVELFRPEVLNLPESPRHMFRGRHGA